MDRGRLHPRPGRRDDHPLGARDYGRFLRAILRGGELDGARVLSSATVDLAFSDQLNGLPLPDLIPTRAPWLIHDVVALPFRQT
jgi:methyl acetate hydrolase